MAPQDIVLRQTNDERGNETNHDDDAGGADHVFQERYARAMKTFKEYRDRTGFINHVTREVLCAMCEAEGLSTSGYKIDLLSRLKKWVGFPKNQNLRLLMQSILSSESRISSLLLPEKKLRLAEQC